MAFTVTARHSGTTGATAAQTLATSSTTPTTSSLLLAFWGHERDNHTTAESWQAPTGGGWTYSQVAVSAAFAWDGLAAFSVAAAMYRADVGVSALSHTVTVDSWSGTPTGYYSAVCCDITGHDTTTPVVQSATNGGTHDQGNAEIGTVTLASAPAVGNLVVVGFIAGNDQAGAFVAPTIGGQAMTELFNQTPTFAHAGLWYRVITGAETNAVITCSDLGQVVGAYAAVAVEIAVAGGGTTPVGKDLALQWDTRQAVGDPVQAVWDVHAAVSDTVQALWDVRQAVGDPVALQWDTRTLATKSVQALWDVRQAIGDPIQLVWDVQSALTAVGKDLGLQWNTRAAVGDQLQAIWDTRAVVGQSAQLLWDVRAAVADESTLRWDVRTVAAKSAQAIWDVRTAAGDALSLLWDVESNVPLRNITVIAGVASDHITGGVGLTGLIAGVRSSHITGGVDVSRDLRTGSIEYVTAEVTFVGESAGNIAGATGVVQFTLTDATPAAGDPNWAAADVTARTDVTGGAKLALSRLHTAGAAGIYRVWAKVTDNPEVPILLCGYFTVT